MDIQPPNTNIGTKWDNLNNDEKSKKSNSRLHVLSTSSTSRVWSRSKLLTTKVWLLSVPMMWSSFRSIACPMPMAITVTFGTLWRVVAACTVRELSLDRPSVRTMTYLATPGRAPWFSVKQLSFWLIGWLLIVWLDRVLRRIGNI